jgi:hypothetical protein
MQQLRIVFKKGDKKAQISALATFLFKYRDINVALLDWCSYVMSSDGYKS